jgi:ActR/RegA family two-component response regulator
MPEVGLGIGVESGTHEGITQDWLYWYDQQGNRYPAPEDAIALERQRTELAQRQLEVTEQQLEATQQQLEAERRSRQDLLEKLRRMGINPDEL